MIVFWTFSPLYPIFNNIQYKSHDVKSAIINWHWWQYWSRIIPNILILPNYTFALYCFSLWKKNIFINAIYYCLPDLSLLSWLSPSYLTLMLQPISFSWWACRAHEQSISPSSTLSMHSVVIIWYMLTCGHDIMLTCWHVTPGHVGGQPEDGVPGLAVHAAAHVRARALDGGPASLRLARRPQLIHAQAARVQVRVVLHRTSLYSI